MKATQRVASTERGRLARLARYATRVVVAVGALRFREDGRVEVETPPDPVTGSTVLVLDRLELVHALCQQIPDKGMHLVRFYGAYSNRRRGALRRLRGEVEGAPAGDGTLGPRPKAAALAATPAGSGSATASAGPGRADRPPTAAEVARAVSWAKLLRKVFEVDPLRCPRCGGSMAVIAWITEAATIDPESWPTVVGRGSSRRSRERRPGHPPRRDVAPRGVPGTRLGRQETVSPQAR